MKVILTEKITKLGNIGDAVEVKTGYARNFLLPNGKAMRFEQFKDLPLNDGDVLEVMRIVAGG